MRSSFLDAASYYGRADLALGTNVAHRHPTSVRKFEPMARRRAARICICLARQPLVALPRDGSGIASAAKPDANASAIRPDASGNRLVNFIVSGREGKFMLALCCEGCARLVSTWRSFVLALATAALLMPVNLHAQAPAFNVV